jgi:putative transposase
MSDYGSLAHSKWDCKYHIVFIPKYRKRKLFCQVRRYLGDVFHELARQKSSKIVEGHMMPDHVHMCVSIPPKHSVAQVIGYIKGKSAIAVARQFGGKKRNFNGERLWARGYAVSTVGFELDQVKEYIRNQSSRDKDDDDNDDGEGNF